MTLQVNWLFFLWYGFITVGVLYVFVTNFRKLLLRLRQKIPSAKLVGTGEVTTEQQNIIWELEEQLGLESTRTTDTRLKDSFLPIRERCIKCGSKAGAFSNYCQTCLPRQIGKSRVGHIQT